MSRLLYRLSYATAFQRHFIQLSILCQAGCIGLNIRLTDRNGD